MHIYTVHIIPTLNVGWILVNIFSPYVSSRLMLKIFCHTILNHNKDDEKDARQIHGMPLRKIIGMS